MTFTYKAVTNTGEKKEGSIEAPNKDLAIAALQRRGFIVVSVKGEEDVAFFKKDIFSHIPVKDIVILSRQVSTLFDAQVSALKAFTLLGTNAENPLLKKKLIVVTDDIQAGMSISGALAKHPEIFSDFYVNMVKAGEESGKLNQVFAYLADYLDAPVRTSRLFVSVLIDGSIPSSPRRPAVRTAGRGARRGAAVH